MKVEEMVGERMRIARESRGFSQPELGRLLGEYLGAVWPRQTVSSAERGKRAFTASELFAIAYVLGLSVAELFAPLAEMKEVELSSGAVISMDMVSSLRIADNPPLEAAHDMANVVADLKKSNELDRSLLVSLSTQLNEIYTALAEGGR